MPKYTYIFGCFISLIFTLSGCQFFIDGRDEPLLLVDMSAWAEFQQFQEKQRIAKHNAQRPQPLNGSEHIRFINKAEAHLAGCQTMGILEIHHYGYYDDILILARNQAYQLNASVITPLDIYQDTSAARTEKNRANFIKGRMLRCPHANMHNNREDNA